jgi:hypothetical protein
MPLPWSTKRRNASTASGQVIDLRDRNSITDLGKTKMAWQAIAWNYRDLIPELGSALRNKANIISKVQFTIAAVSGGDDEPNIIVLEDGDGNPTPDEDLPVDRRVAEAARDCLSRLPFGSGYRFQGMISQSFDIPGECWLHGFPDQYGDEQWMIRSTSEVIPGNGGLGIIDIPGRAARPINAKTETLIRLWVPHPQWSGLADSPLRTMLDVCEDVILAGREIRAASKSRIAANGIILIPNELTLMARSGATLDPENDRFSANFTAAITAPIMNEGDAGSVAPILVRGEAEDLKEVRHVRFERETSDDLLGKMQAALNRIADGLDLPSDAMRVGEMNHWSGAMMDAAKFKEHIEPSCRLIVDSLTESYFRRLLMLPESDNGYGLTKDEALSVQIWYDAGNITENANRSADADAAMDRGGLSYVAYRKAKGFNEDDAPDEEDLKQLAMFKGTTPPDTLSQLAAEMLGTQRQQTPQIIQGQVRQPAQIEEMPRGPGDPPRTPSTAPDTAPSGVRVASSGPAIKVRSGDRLAEIDAALRDRIMQAADDALIRALEKAGNKVKAKVQGKDAALALQVKGADPVDVCAMVGRDRLEELGLTEDILLAAAFAYLAVKFTQWSTYAITQSVKAVAEMTYLPLSTLAALTQAMTARIPAAWKRLEGSLKDRAMAKLYGRAGDELRGEVPDTIVLPGDVRDALSEIGGGSTTDGGIALGGDILRTLDAQGPRVGFTWRYGVTPRSRHFEPHFAIAGRRFEGYDDPALIPEPKYAWIGSHYKPGDHSGCMCDYVPSWALVEADDIAQSVIDEESGAMRGERHLAELDDAAGRTGTHSQRTRDQRDRMVAVQQKWLDRE